MFLNHDICTSIISYLPKTGANNRVDANLWIGISLLCEIFQHSVYAHVESFNRNLKWDKTKSLRWFIGEINRENAKLKRIAFRYVNNPDAQPEQNAIAGCSPFLQNYQGQSLIDVVISQRYRILYLEQSGPTLKLLLSHMSIEELKKYFPKVINRCMSQEEHIQLLNCLFESFVEKTSESDAKEFFQVQLGKKMYEPKPDFEKELIYNWMIDKGMVLNIEYLFYYFANGIIREADSIKEILLRKGLDHITSNGDRLIHALLKGPLPRETIQSGLEWINKYFPFEIKAKDNAGKSAISYIFDARVCKKFCCRRLKMEYHYNLLSEKIFTPNLLWELREECFQTLLEYVKKDKMRVFEQRSEQPDAFLQRILSLFPDEDGFIKWFNEPYGDEKKCLGDEFSIWCPPIMQVLRNKMCTLLCFEIDDELNCLAWRLKNVSNCTSDQFKLMEQYPGLKESIRLEIFRNLFVSEFDNNFEEMNKVFGPDWFQYKDADGNTLIHYLLSNEATDNKFRIARVAETIDYMIDNGLDLNREERKSLIGLARVNGWYGIVDLLK